MKLNKLGRVLGNPDSIRIFLKSKSVSEAKLHLRKLEARKKMAVATQMADSLLSQNEPIGDIIETVSSKTGMTKYPIAWYCLVRKFAPAVIVETGTSMGWSSFMILSAIKNNKKGHLYSFDLDSSENVKKGGGVGYLVTEDLKENWTLKIEDTKKGLEPILKELKSIDMFIHDSEHTYETMMFEYNLAWGYLKKGGVLCSDDINHSKAFEEFTEIHRNEINSLHTFQEIQRPSDDKNLRPYVGYFFKNQQ